jgi:hypothetical protein
MGHFLVKVTSRLATGTAGTGSRTVCKNSLLPCHASTSLWFKVAAPTWYCRRFGPKRERKWQNDKENCNIKSFADNLLLYKENNKLRDLKNVFIYSA